MSQSGLPGNRYQMAILRPAGPILSLLGADQRAPLSLLLPPSDHAWQPAKAVLWSKPFLEAGEIPKEDERDCLEGLVARHQDSPVTTVPGETEEPHPRQTSCSLGSCPTPPGAAPNVRYQLGRVAGAPKSRE
jgi:hypothetical protein